LKNENTKIPFWILPTIVFSQFAGTSLWFAGNAVLPDLQQALNLDETALGSITSAVQFGFIVGTFVFAFLAIADRFSPSKIFLISSLLGAVFNLLVFLVAKELFFLLLLRFLTGFFLAGIYPVGMKIAADWYAKGLGRALGYLVGALVLGTAFPHLLRQFTQSLPWQTILQLTSALAAAGGLSLFLLVSEGPYRKKGTKFEWDAILKIFSFKDFRHAAFGYFGHMWELYTMWAFVPVMLASYNNLHQTSLPVPLWSFDVIAIGGLGCVFGGYVSLKKGSAKVAFGMLLTSGICCLLSPLFFTLPEPLFLAVLLIWGFAVVGDSPQFSTLVAQTAPKHYVGTALTIVNCIGFALTIGSIQLLTFLFQKIAPQYLYLVLIIGPVFGLFSIFRNGEKINQASWLLLLSLFFTLKTVIIST